MLALEPCRMHICGKDIIAERTVEKSPAKRHLDKDFGSGRESTTRKRPYLPAMSSDR